MAHISQERRLQAIGFIRLFDFIHQMLDPFLVGDIFYLH